MQFIQSAGGIVAVAIIAFTVASHVLIFIAQLLKDFNKDVPGWLNSTTNALAKVLDFLNGQKKPAAPEAPKA